MRRPPTNGHEVLVFSEVTVLPGTNELIFWLIHQSLESLHSLGGSLTSEAPTRYSCCLSKWRTRSWDLVSSCAPSVFPALDPHFLFFLFIFFSSAAPTSSLSLPRCHVSGMNHDIAFLVKLTDFGACGV